MNKNKIKQFAIWARTELIEQVSQRAYQYGITADGYGDADAVTIGERALNQEERKQRQELVAQIRQKGYPQVMEEVAYTWFNRFIALRFMEVNNYLPTHIRVFSDSNDQFKPEILNDVLHLDLPNLDQTKVAQYLEANRTDDLYRYLLLLQCNSLNEALPVMFEPMGSYTEMLLPNNILKSGSILDRLVNDIPAEDWLDQVQIIGWLYQYYNSELKDELINAKKQYDNLDIPYVTQLFTSEWIVCYMVENSLGRMWLEGHPDETLRQKWKFFLAPQNNIIQENESQFVKIYQEYAALTPEDITIIDPCMGSGHILAYAFDVLIQIYENQGYAPKDAVKSIVEKNLYGLDIDPRAYQLAYFAIMMKAQQYDRRFLRRSIQPNLYCIQESNYLDPSEIEYFCNGEASLINNLNALIKTMQDAKIFGSAIMVRNIDFSLLYKRLNNIKDDIHILHDITFNNIMPLIQSAEILSRKYSIVITNPPYMGAKYMPPQLKKFVSANYENYKSDLFAVFIKRCSELCVDNGQMGFLTPYVWMFIQSYENMRKFILSETTISSLIQLEYNAFESACVPVAAFTLRNYSCDLPFDGIKLSDFKGSENQEPKTLEAVQNPLCNYRYTATQDNFSKIPGSPIAYWVSEAVIQIYMSSKLIKDYGEAKQGIATGENEKFMRFWFEPTLDKCAYPPEKFIENKTCKWYPYHKGGEFRKWYGNNDYVVNWFDDGYEIKHFTDKNGKLRSRPQNLDYMLKKCITWSLTNSSSFGARFRPEGYFFDINGMSLFIEEDLLNYALAYLCSIVAISLMHINNPTLASQAGDIARLPFIINDNRINDVNSIVKKCIWFEKNDWDSFETSWDFKKHPLT